METNYFTDFFKNVFDVNATIKTKTVRGKPALWLTGDLKRYMDNKVKTLRKARKIKSDDDWDAYWRIRNICNAKVKEAERKYYRKSIEEHKSNPRKSWDAVKAVLPSKSKISADSSTKKSANKTLLNEFSKCFGKAFTELKSKIFFFFFKLLLTVSYQTN